MENIEQLKKILSDHEKRIRELEANNSIFIKNRINKESSINALSNLLKDEFFDNPKKFGQIIKQLKINAQFSKGVDYKKELEALVQERKLKRKMIDHQWVYSKIE